MLNWANLSKLGRNRVIKLFGRSHLKLERLTAKVTHSIPIFTGQARCLPGYSSGRLTIQ